MKVIEEKPWSWRLYKRDDEYILSVLCGSVAMYGREITLNASEEAEYLQYGIADLAKKIAYEPNKYSSRQILDFHNDPAVKKADTDWRNTKET